MSGDHGQIEPGESKRAHESSTALKAQGKAISLLPALMNPRKALATAYQRPRADFLRQAYELATLRDVLRGKAKTPELSNSTTS